MGRAVEIVHRQLRDKMRALVVQRLWFSRIRHVASITVTTARKSLQGVHKSLASEGARCILQCEGRMTYFDHNATAPLHPSARQAWLEAVEKFLGK